MKSRPILFSAPMVRALLCGRKTQTRRICKHQHWSYSELHDLNKEGITQKVDRGVSCSYGQTCDRLWVKETWKPDPSWGFPPKTKPTDIAEGTHILYRATLDPAHPKAAWQDWRPSLFMRRWMSRITLEVTEIRVERLQDISEADAMAEGIFQNKNSVWHWSDDSGIGGVDPVDAYRSLWESINGLGSWDANPWVWCVNFKRVEEK